MYCTKTEILLSTAIHNSRNNFYTRASQRWLIRSMSWIAHLAFQVSSTNPMSVREHPWYCCICVGGLGKSAFSRKLSRVGGFVIRAAWTGVDA
jgi:hypothetical protein